MFDIWKYLFTLNLLLSVFSVFILIAMKFQKTTYQEFLKLCYFLLFSIFFIPFIVHLVPKTSLISSQRLWTEIASIPSDANPVSVMYTVSEGVHHFDYVHGIKVFFFLALMLYLLYLSKSLFSIYRIIKSAYSIRSYRSVRILFSDQVSVPFAFWIPFRHYVILSEELLLNSNFKSLALAHELQHHRQSDTKWVYILQILKIFCFMNPCVYLLTKSFSELQEFACDEVLLGRQNISSSAYSRCLLWVAEKSLFTSPTLGTLTMVQGGAKKFLMRRMDMIFHTRKQSFRRLPLVLLGGIVLSAFLGLAHTASAFQIRTVSLKDAQTMLEHAKKDTEFPIVVNDLVLERLNYYLGTDEGRMFMRGALERWKQSQQLVNSTIESYGLPYELAAIPIVESGYMNTPQNERSVGAGWWMFIQETARNFGLQVNASVDERLDTVLETKAAMRLLGALNYQFEDWGLALLAFNSGSGKVLEGLRDPKINSRNVWSLIRGGYEGDPQYLASVFAAILIMKNPSSLDR